MSLRYVRDFSVGGSVGDPAIILSVTAFFAAGCLLISLLRTTLNETALLRRPDEAAATPASVHLQPSTGVHAEMPEDVPQATTHFH